MSLLVWRILTIIFRLVDFFSNAEPGVEPPETPPVVFGWTGVKKVTFCF